MDERIYQKKLINKIKDRFPEALIQKQDSRLHAGIPDLLIIYKNRWAMLEVKKSKQALHQPGQDEKVREFNEWGFASFIFPENENLVLQKLFDYLEGSANGD